jgi:hypothetical protein
MYNDSHTEAAAMRREDSKGEEHNVLPRTFFSTVTLAEPTRHAAKAMTGNADVCAKFANPRASTGNSENRSLSTGSQFD